MFSKHPWIPGALKFDSILSLFKCAHQWRQIQSLSALRTPTKVLVDILDACAVLLRLEESQLNTEVRETICVSLERMDDIVMTCQDPAVRNAYLDAVAQMPLANLDRLSSPVRFWEVRAPDMSTLGNAIEY